MDPLSSTLSGAVAALSLIAALFFANFWVRTKDSFFALFALAFAVDGLARLITGAVRLTNESEPYAYLPRLLTFSLIIAAVVIKNRPRV